MSTVYRKIYHFITVLALFALGVAAERVGFIDYLSRPSVYPEILDLITEHVILVATSMALATVTGVTVGIVFTRRCMRRFSGIVMYVVGLGQTVPSLAVLALTMGFLGVGVKTAVFALFIYSVLPIARNTLAGITSVPPALIDAAKGMGMPPLRVLISVELPNAMKVIVTGFRVALVINIGTAALAQLIGAGGLGELIFTGINMRQTEKLLAGAVPVTLLALFADSLCDVMSYAIIPRGLRLEDQ